MHSDIVILSDRIKELSHTAGQGALTLDGELAGFSPFSDFYEYGDVVYYAATDGTRYEVGSGEYRQNGSNNELTRFPLRSSNLNSGPYYLNGKSADGATRGQEGYFYPLFLTKSSALAVAGATSAHTHAFSGYPGVTFYMPNNHAAHAQGSAASATGVDYAASGLPVNFPDAGIKEVYVTYPGKYSVFTGYGISGYREPKMSGVAFWGSEQLLNYDSDMLWSDARANLGISQTNPQFAIDIGGDRAYSQIRASGFFGGGSGIYFSGGQALPQDATKTASGGRQLEPFFRNKLDGTTGTDAVFYLSGIVNESICFLPQEKGTIFSGPASGCETAGCSPATPTFRFLTLEDIPDLSSLYVVQSKTMDENPNTLTQNGAIALYQESGIITYDDGFVFLKSANRLGIGTNAPNYALDVMGGNLGVSGDIITSGDIYTAYGSNVHSSGGVFARTDSYFGNDVTISGDLFVKGTTTYIDSTNVTIHDKQLELASLSGNAIHDDVDSLIDDGGILVRSSGNGSADTGDKKWTWKNASNTWAATTSNGENLGITSSGIIFNGGMGTVSGAYLAGSGLTLLNNKLTFAIGNMFNVGAVASGHDGNDGNYITNQIHQADEIGFSGIHGVAVNVSGEPSNLAAGGFVSGITLTVDPSGLSGLLYNEITHSGAAVSGLANTAITAVSGTLKYTIDNGAGYAGWKVKQEDNETLDTIATTEAVLFSGVSGVNVDYVPGTNTLLFDAVALSGNLQHNIDASGAAVSGYALYYTNASGNYLRDQIQLSGVAVSGFALNYTDASGNFLLNSINASGAAVSGLANTAITAVSGTLKYRMDQITPSTAGSGLIKVPLTDGSEVINMNVDGSGQISHLLFKDDKIRIGQNAAAGTFDYNLGSGAIAIGDRAGLYSTLSHHTVFLGSGAGVSSSGNNYNILIGNSAGASSSGNHFVTAIGHRAARYTNLVTQSTNFIGREAGGWASGCDNSNIIGMFAGYKIQNVDNANLIGNRAGYEAASMSGFNCIGLLAGADAIGGTDSNLIGTNAGSGTYASGNLDGFYSSNMIGNDAGKGAVCQPGSGYVNFIGHKAGAHSWRSDFCDFIGYEAGYAASSGQDALDASTWSAGATEVIAIGKKAFRESARITQLIAIGSSAGRQIPSGSNGNILIGKGAGAYVSGYLHENNVYVGTNAASGITWGEYNVGLGYKAMENSIQKANGKSSLGQNVAIGYEPMVDSSGVGMSVAIGYKAMHGASGYLNSSNYITKNVAIGYHAAKDAEPLDENVFLGSHAGQGSVKTSYEVSIGRFAGYETDHEHGTARSYNVNIGDHAGYHSKTLKQNVNLGHWAGADSSGWNSYNNVAIGPYSMSASSGDLNAVAIGYYAGKEHNGAQGNDGYGNIQIGYKAGYQGRGGHNILLGSDAGKEQYLSNAIVIKHNSNSSNSNWINATAPEDSTLSLGTSIFSAYENANTQIGKEPSSVSDFSSYILRVATHSDSKVVLKTTRNGSSHTAGDQIQSSLDSSDKANTIVNAYGFLQIPIATSSTGTGATRRLFLADGTAIEEIEGTVVVWKGGTEYRLAIYVGSSWRKLANNLSAW